jgi:hypothetical protein
MGRKHFSTEQIIAMLREVEVRLGQGQRIGVICKALGFRSRAITAGVGRSSKCRRNNQSAAGSS